MEFLCLSDMEAVFDLFGMAPQYTALWPGDLQI